MGMVNLKVEKNKVLGKGACVSAEKRVLSWWRTEWRVQQKGNMKKIRFILEYLILIAVGGVARRLPRKAVVFLGKGAGDLIFYCVPVRRKLTLEQLKIAFPDKSADDIRRIARDVFRNLALNSIEHLCYPGLSKDALLEIVRFDNLEILESAYAKNKGVIYVGGHFGNWEYMGSAVSSLGYPVSYVVADIGNPYIDKMVNDHRKSTGVTIITKGMSVRGTLQTLKAGGTMAMLMDQDAGRHGIFLDFFGRKCSTVKGPALFALKTHAAVVFVATIRQEDGTLRAIFEDVEIDYSKGATDENIHEIMQRCTSKLEQYIRKYPGHWFWMHRRWKTQPDTHKKQM